MTIKLLITWVDDTKGTKEFETEKELDKYLDFHEKWMDTWDIERT